MNRSQKGIAPVVIILIIVVLLTGGVLAWQYSSKVLEKGIPGGKEERTPLEEPSKITAEQKMLGRDIARKVDFKQIETALELYYSDFEKYPGIPGTNQWSVIPDIFSRYDLGSAPQETQKGHPLYEYWVSNNKQGYILKATMETDYGELKTDIDGWPLGEGRVYCGASSPQEREYCVGKGFKVTAEPTSEEFLQREDETAKKTRDARRKADIQSIKTVLTMYYTDQYKNPKYPSVAGSNQWEILENALVPNYLDYLPSEEKPGHPFYEYWVSSDGQKYILKATLETHDSDLDKDIDNYPLGMGMVNCGVQGLNEREFCIKEINY